MCPGDWAGSAVAEEVSEILEVSELVGVAVDWADSAVAEEISEVRRVSELVSGPGGFASPDGTSVVPSNYVLVTS